MSQLESSKRVRTKAAARTAAPVVEAPKKPAAKKRVVAPEVIETTVVPSLPANDGSAQAPKRRRTNRRSEETITNILAAAEKVVLESGADRISILEVCEIASISRGTFYRYFASQDELLDAFSRHKRERFHRSLVEATEPHTHPDARFDAVVQYLQAYLEHGNSRRLLTVAPEYALNFFKRIFHDSVVRFQDVLGIVFDAWDARLGVRIDRELVCELLIRYVLSEQLVPSDGGVKTLPRRVARLVEALVLGTAARVRR